MSDQSVNRRDFLKLIGLGGAGFAVPTVIGKSSNGYLVESEEEYSGFLVEKLSGDKPPYEYDPNVLKRMNEKFTIFSRNVWDPARQDRPKEDLTKIRLVDKGGKEPNQTRLDYALQAAAWASAAMGGGPAYEWSVQTGQIKGLLQYGLAPWDPADIDMSWEEASLAVKHAALFYGASLAGIAELNPLWVYSDAFAPSKEDIERTIPVLEDGDRLEQAEDAWYIPASLNRVIAMAFEEDYYAMSNSPGRLASAATGNGYSRMAFTSYSLAEFIRGLGYRAIPAGNGVGLSIPIAIDAGLGQLGRNGLLVTPKYGPRVRLAKVITDMPLVPDAPINFGVTEFCEACKICATECPSGAISTGPMTFEGKSASNNPGTKKWYVEVEKCYDYNGFSCSNCKRTCPFNKPNNSWLHRMTREIVNGKAVPLNSIMRNLDQASGYGVQLDDTEFWKMDGSKSITAREKM